jgi:hypothetical protein
MFRQRLSEILPIGRQLTGLDYGVAGKSSANERKPLPLNEVLKQRRRYEIHVFFGQDRPFHPAGVDPFQGTSQEVASLYCQVWHGVPHPAGHGRSVDRGQKQGTAGRLRQEM